ncbi:MAG: carbohydrate ABC transporter permease [Actinomycetota bacterium]
MAPVAITAVLFLFIPMGFSAYWSFTDFNGLASPEWVGLDNYTALIGDHRFRAGLLNTTIFVILGMGIGPLLGLGSALLLNRRVRFRAFFRAAFFLPVMTSLVVVGTIWKNLLQEQGVVNVILGFFGIPGRGWLGDPGTALPAVTAASIWQGFGFETVVFLAALQAIPRELYEAARVDGASAWHKFRHVTLPGLRHAILFVYVIGIIGSFQVFDQVYVMTQGGPITSTRTIVFDLFDRFNSLDLGEASAVAYVLLLILGTLSYLQLRFVERRG